MGDHEMALLLIPGFMADADLWRDMEDALASYGPVLHADTSRDDTISAMARRALAQAPNSSILVGFSMGGYVAREIARLAPDRVSALVLVATSARGDTADQARRKAAAASQIAASGRFAGLSRSVVASSLHPDRANDDALVSRIQAMAVRLGPGVFRRQSLMPREGDLATLGEVRCPTLVIAGRQDRLRSIAEAEELHAGINGSELLVIEGVGHMIPIEAPGALVGAMAPWLERLPPPSPHTGVG
jgi:pimeloyl-ACP methyl ester carboxylesterase